MSASLTDHVCETSIRLYFDRSQLKFIFVVEVLLGVTATLSSTLLTLSIFFNKLLHFNVRISLICFCAALLVANVGIVLNSVYYLISIFYRSPAERCQWLTFAKSDCFAMRNVYSFGATVLVVSTLFLSIERITATLLYRTYEQHQRKWIGFLLAILQWVVGVPIVFCQNKSSGLVLPYCAIELFNPTLSKSAEYILIVVQSCAILIFIVLWNHNRKISMVERPNENALSIRYQIRENIATRKLTMPIVLLSGFFMLSQTLLYAVFLPVHSLYSDVNAYLDDVSRYSIYSEIQLSMLPLMTTVLVYFMGRFDAHIRHSLAHLLGLYRCLSKSGNVVDVTPEEHARHLYFDQLQQQWNQLNGESCDHSRAISRTERAAIYAT
ncbi:Serpentine receptor class alpha/beta-14 [Toxocara canis]|uniref:Serpentine receptor class alpha/beta-14 n=1 Tax=Toxocara canis TaxID=6265 RepID=A0A0B2W1D1_TOXCA|nr:Serpentine receptor class alpha/beta-14 [Toxocara canis]